MVMDNFKIVKEFDQDETDNDLKGLGLVWVRLEVGRSSYRTVLSLEKYSK